MAKTTGPTEPAEMGAAVIDTVESLVELHREQYRAATGPQRSIDWLTERLGRPLAVIAIILILLCWALCAAVSSGGAVGSPII